MDDPDDLAAAFFAQQAAKERKKATLPTDDWMKVAEANESKKQNNHGTCTSALASANTCEWLVTEMPKAGEYETHDSGDQCGIIGIKLETDTSNNIISINNFSNEKSNENGDELRRRLKEYLVQKLLFKK